MVFKMKLFSKKYRLELPRYPRYPREVSTYKQEKENLDTLLIALKFMINEVHSVELDLFPNYPVISLDPVILGLLGSALRPLGVMAESKIKELLPDKAILLLSNEDKVCTTYSKDLDALARAGICYGGLDCYTYTDSVDPGYMNVVPIYSEKFPVEDYELASAIKLHGFPSLGVCTRSGKYLVAHFIMGLLMRDLYHDDADMVSIGQPNKNTSECYIPHTHYKKKDMCP